MAGPLAPAIVGAVGSLLGGLLGKSKTTTTYTDPMNETARAIAGQAYGAREAGKNHQFNPLTLLGVSSPMGGQPITTSTENFMGSAVADAAMLVADGMAKAREEKSALSAAQQENDKLKQKVNDLTLRPRVGGIYANVERTPSVREALGAPATPDFLPGVDVAPSPVDTMPNDPDLMSAQSAEDGYGEIGGMLQGVYNMAVVPYRNSTDPMREKPKVRPKPRPAGYDIRPGWNGYGF